MKGIELRSFLRVRRASAVEIAGKFGTDCRSLSERALAKGVHPIGDGKCAEVLDGIGVVADPA